MEDRHPDRVGLGMEIKVGQLDPMSECAFCLERECQLFPNPYYAQITM